MNENDLLAAILGQTKLVAEGEGGGSQKWGSGQTLFDGANLYYSDGTTFVDSSGNVTITGGTINGVVIGGSAPEAGTFTTLNTDGDVRFTGGDVRLNNSVRLAGDSTNGNLNLTLFDGSGWGRLLTGQINLSNTTSPSTPTGGFILYSISGQPHTLDVNGVNINLSLSPQPDTGWTANSDAGHKAIAIASSMTRQAYQSALNILVAGAGDDLYTIGEKLKALEAALSSNPSLYPNA